jgi:hypothetical protein
VAALERGLRNTAQSPMLQSALGKLTPRKRPLLPFLPRSNKVNRKLGELRHRNGAILRA